MKPKWARIDALMGGTDAMRAAGETYLPRFKEEDPAQYDRRLASSVLFGGFEQTVTTMVGMPFSKPIALGEDVPQRLIDLAEDIDQAGTHLDVFARDRFREGLAKGAEHILVDMDGDQPETAADDLRRRPRWVPVTAEQLIDARYETIDGRKKFAHVRIRETVTEWNGFEEKRIEQIREITPPEWKIWRKSGESWAVHAEGPYGMPYVTLAPFFAGPRKGDFTATPPLDNLAHINVCHWQSASDQRNILTVSRFAILFTKGVEAGTTLTIGPLSMISSDSKDADAKFIEHNGSAIEAGERDLDTLKREMESEGVRMLTRRPGNITATENAIDESKDQSELEAIARGFADTLEVALGYTAEWIGEVQGGSVTLNGDYGVVANAQAIKEVVIELRKLGDLSAEDAMGELQRAKLLSDAIIPSEAVERAREEVQDVPLLGAQGA
ncbi:DUF4055 domain-containing protein [Pacificimonas sp. ICDLI1SI03]